MARLFKNSIQKVFKAFIPWHTPLALPIGKGSWNDWKKEQLKKYPIRFRLFKVYPEAIDIFLTVKYRRFIDDPIWAFKHRFIKKHQYHVLRPKTLKPGYHDHNRRILHACMEELCEHYERACKNWSGHPPDNSAYDDNEYWTTHYNIEREVYNYWKTERQQLIAAANNVVSEDLHKRLNKLASDNDVGRIAITFHEDFRDDPVVKEYRKCLDKSRRLDEEIRAKDKTNLRKIIRILDGLWD